ncbi:MAG: SRPBCC family protein [Saprospiraceae bacterium]|nr:SRPBCC family protein [Saprospiraceae bacterium]
MRLETSVEIGQPPSVVYDFINDEENLSLWVSNFVSTEHLKGEDGEVGSSYKHMYEENGRPYEMIEEIIELVKDEKISLRLSSDENTIDIINNLISKASGKATLLKVVLIYSPKNIFNAIKLFLFRNSMLKRSQEDLLKLKQAIEKLVEIDLQNS